MTERIERSLKIGGETVYRLDIAAHTLTTYEQEIVANSLRRAADDLDPTND